MVPLSLTATNKSITGAKKAGWREPRFAFKPRQLQALIKNCSNRA